MERRIVFLLLACAIFAILVVTLSCVRREAEPTRDPAALTPPPAKVAAAAERRGLPSYQLLAPITLDGDLGDWDQEGMVVVDTSTAAFVAGVIDNAADLSAQVRSRWDNDGLYFAVRVFDDRLAMDSGTQVWHDDGIELGLDGVNDQNPYGSDDHQYTVRPDGYITDRGLTSQVAVGNLTTRVRTHSNGYSIEMRIPLANVGGGAGFVGREMGFTIGIHDDDDGGRYDAYVIWEGNNSYNGAATFGLLSFTSTQPTPTPSQTRTSTPSITPVPSRTLTPTITGTPPTLTPTLSPTRTGTPTRTLPPTTTPTLTLTPSPTPNTLSLYPSEDTYISAWDPTGNYVGNFTARVRPVEMSALFQFDLGGVPNTATVLSATLRLYIVQGGAYDLSTGVYRLLRSWTPSEATWQRPNRNETWGQVGARRLGVDYTEDTDASLVLRGQNVWIEVPVTALVQYWVNHPQENFGLAVHGGGATSVEYSLITVNNPVTEVRPRLLFTWAQLTPTVTPTRTGTLPPTPTTTRTPTATSTSTATHTPTVTPGLDARIRNLRTQIATLEAQIARLLETLRQLSGTATPTPLPGLPTPTRTHTPRPTSSLAPEDEAVSLERRVRELEQVMTSIEDILRQFGTLP